MATIARLVVDVLANTKDFRQGMSETVQMAERAQERIDGIVKAIKTLNAANGDFRIPKGFGEFGHPGSSTQRENAIRIYESQLNMLQNAMSSFSRSVEIVNMHLIDQGTANVVAARTMQQANRAAGAMIATISSSAKGEIVEMPARLNRIASVAAGKATPAIVKLGGAIERLRLANYNFLASAKQWNTMGVIAGIGPIGKALDSMAKGLFGIIPPIRQLVFLMQNLLTPALAAFGIEALKAADNPAMQKLGEGLLKVSKETMHAGESFQVSFGEHLFGRFRLLGAASDMVVSSMTRGLIPVLGSATSGAVNVGAAAIDRLSVALLGNDVGVARAAQTVGYFREAISDFRNDVQGVTGPLKVFTENTIRAAVTVAKWLIPKLWAACKALVSLAAGLIRLVAVGLARAITGFARLAMSVGRGIAALFRFKGSADVAGAAAAKAGQAANGGTKGFEGLRNAMSSLMPLALRFGAIGGAAVGVLAAGKAGIAAADEMEKGVLKYEVLLGSAEAATKRIGELTKFAAATPFEMGEITQADQMLQQFGIRSEAMLTAVGNAAAVSGADFGELSKIMGQLSQSKELENINQLVDRGVVSFSELTAAGITFAKDRSVQNSVAETYEAVAGIIQKKFAGGMDKLANTMTGKLSTLKDAVNLTLGKLAVSSGLVDGIKVALDWMIKLAEYMGAIGAPLILKAIGIIRAVVTPTFTRIASVIIGNFDLIQSAAMAVFYFIVDIATWAAMGLWSLFSSALGMIGEFLGGTFLGNAFGAFGSFAEMVQTAFLIVEYAATNWRKVFELAFWAAILTIVMFVEQVKYFFTTVIPAVLIWFVGNFRDIFFTALDYVLTIFINLGNNIREIWSEVWDFIASGGTNAIEIDWTPLTKGAVSALKELPQISDRVIGDVENGLKNKVAGLRQDLVGGFDKFKEGKLQKLEPPPAAAADQVKEQAANAEALKHPGGVSDRGKKGKGPAIESVDEYFKKLQESGLKKDDTAKETLKEARRGNNIAQQQLDETKKAQGKPLKFGSKK